MTKPKKTKMTNEEKLEQQLYHDKEVAFYTAVINAWVTTKFEGSKHLLNLSAGGIGLLVTLAMTVKEINSVLFILAVLAFLVCVITTLLIFHFNARHLENVAQEIEEQYGLLKCLDWISYISFSSGLILAFSIGIMSLN